MANPITAIVNLLFYARCEADGTFTLCLDAPQGAEQFPTEIAKGYAAPGDIVRVLVDALTAPAVAEDRVAALEEYMPALNTTIDQVNAHGQELAGVDDRLAKIEAWIDAMQAAGGVAARPPARPIIPRPGQAVPQTVPPALRRSVVQVVRQQQPQPQPTFDGPPTRPALDRPQQEFTRETTVPHIPVGRVSRGPGSE